MDHDHLLLPTQILNQNQNFIYLRGLIVLNLLVWSFSHIIGLVLFS